MQKRQHERSCEIKGSAWPRSGCGGLIIAKFLITIIIHDQVNFGADSQLEEATQIRLHCCY